MWQSSCCLALAQVAAQRAMETEKPLFGLNAAENSCTLNVKLISVHDTGCAISRAFVQKAEIRSSRRRAVPWLDGFSCVARPSQITYIHTGILHVREEGGDEPLLARDGP